MNDLEQIISIYSCYLKHRWPTFLLLIGPVMVIMWIVSSSLIYLILMPEFTVVRMVRMHFIVFLMNGEYYP